MHSFLKITAKILDRKEVIKMSLHTYTVTLNGKVVGIKAKK